MLTAGSVELFNVIARLDRQTDAAAIIELRIGASFLNPPAATAITGD